YRAGFAPVDPSAIGRSIDPVTRISPVLLNGLVMSDACGIVGMTSALVVTTPLPPPIRGKSASPRLTTSIWVCVCQWASGDGNTWGAWSIPRLTGVGATDARTGEAVPDASVNTTGSGETSGAAGA